ncbi:nucleotidyltransferase family protein [Granulicella sp. dw_53]|uniref:nucleotidyltransferase family protein n=1 Tax=Granulicella sp. dw_53 TaxID=2719792 RepID=UPI001BD69EF4|nr:nucleotidyltransferase family protein [Granulicella sp. dw_53]
MRWSTRAERGVVEAVVAALSDSPEQAQEHLSALRYPEWSRSYQWLDASGLALYFLDRLQEMGIEGALPAATLGRLRQNLTDNRGRSSSMFNEFCTINRAFLQANVSFSNLKGFTLSPDSCPNPALRSQLDFDFLIDGEHLERCQDILVKMGYVRNAANRTVWEFKAGSSELARIEDHYKARPQRSVELHFSCAAIAPHAPTRDERLDRTSLRKWGDDSYPVLAAADQFVAQALHLFSHLRSAYTRVSWLLEFRQHLTAHYDDRPFWDEVRERSQCQPDASVAIGLSTLLSTRLFGGRAPAQLAHWTLDRLPAPIRLWSERYGREAVLANFPGTKLYLLLEDELAQSDPDWKKRRRSSLLPRRRAPRISFPSQKESLLVRLRREYYELRFLLFRLHFHVVEGLRYLVEARRWKRQISSQRILTPCAVTDVPRRSRG